MRAVSSSNLAFFSPKTLRFVTAKLGHNRVETLIHGIKTAIEERMNNFEPVEFPKSPGGTYSLPQDVARKYIEGMKPG
jgi:hypothetical protein